MPSVFFFPAMRAAYHRVENKTAAVLRIKMPANSCGFFIWKIIAWKSWGRCEELCIGDLLYSADFCCFAWPHRPMQRVPPRVHRAARGWCGRVGRHVGYGHKRAHEYNGRQCNPDRWARRPDCRRVITPAQWESTGLNAGASTVFPVQIRPISRRIHPPEFKTTTAFIPPFLPPHRTLYSQV